LNRASIDGACSSRLYATFSKFPEPGDYVAAELGEAQTVETCASPEGSVTYPVSRLLRVSDLVTATSEVVDTGRRLAVTTRIGSDGSREALGLFDTVFARACALALAGDGKQRCLPTPDGQIYFLADVFADDECRTGFGLQLSFNPAPVGGLVTNGNETEKVTVYRVLEAASSSYRLMNGACVKDPDYQGGVAVELIAASEFPAFYDVTTSAGALEMVLPTDRQGATTLCPRLIDTEHDWACHFLPTADGENRCLPVALPASFNSQDCGAPVIGVDTARLGTAIYVQQWQGEVCSGGFVLRPRGKRLTAPRVTSDLDVSGYCLWTTYSPYAPQVDYYESGDVVDVTPFVSGTVSNE
jgi:hypothetical protein